MAPAYDGLNAELHGDLTEILAFCDREGSESKRPGPSGPGRQLSVVAGVGFEPTTFRL